MFTFSLTRKMHCLYRGDLRSVSNAFASSLKDVQDDLKSFRFPCLLSILLPFWPVLTFIWTLKWPIAHKLAARMHLTSTMCPCTCTKKNEELHQKTFIFSATIYQKLHRVPYWLFGQAHWFFLAGESLNFFPCLHILSKCVSISVDSAALQERNWMTPMPEHLPAWTLCRQYAAQFRVLTG